MRFAVLTLFCAALAGCPTAIEDGDDAGQAVADTGQVAADSGSTPADDAGVTPATDSGTTPATDAGSVSPADTGPVPSSDAGEPLGDAGLPVGICGTRGGIEDCGPGAFCLFPIEHMCGSTDMGGQCELIPESCTRDYRPVCGCDGNTYSNACQAHVEGVSVEHNGSCEAGCGIPDGRQCDNGEFCLDRGPACGQQRPEGGTCETITRGCAEIFDPVCGCNDRTYSNLCELINAQVQLKSEGECEVAPPPRPDDGACGPPRAPVMCAPTHFCNRPAGSCPVGNESTGGACEERPGLCNRMLAPVCGCDNQEYGNPCQANAAGTSVRNEGPCR